MRLFYNYSVTLLGLFAIVSFSTVAYGAANVTIVPSSDASYLIQGNGIDGVAGIELNIRYDAVALKGSPTVRQESLVSGAMFAANTSLPGSIRIAIISTGTFSGSGPIATVTFASKTASAPLPTVTTSMIDSKGSPIAASAVNTPADTATQGVITSPGVPFSTTPLTSPPPTPSTTPTYPGTVTMPTEQQQQTGPQPVPPPSVTPDQVGDHTAPVIADQTHSPKVEPADAKPAETPQYVVYKSIAARFKQYAGTKSLIAVVDLFDRKVAQTIEQEPAIVLSDGHTKATLTIDIPARVSTSPNFAAKGGTLVSFKQDKRMKGRWIVEVLPETGSNKVTASIITGADEFEYPLTVAQPVKTGLPLDDSGWNRFLTEVGTATSPLHDFNNDGVRDYMDEFIFVANFIASKSAPRKLHQHPAKPGNKK
ncbi:MAG: cohesin domain-containing protein [Pelobacteraceae bacterium]